MNEIRIVASSSALAVNADTWNTAPLTTDLCKALSSDPPAHGDFVVIGRKNDSVFRYFDSLGISILEKLPEQRVKQITLHFQSAEEGRKKLRGPYGCGGERPTAKAFRGTLVLNGKELAAPLPFGRFPEHGDLEFVHRIALGATINAMVGVGSRMVETVSFEFAAQAEELLAR